MLAFRSPGAKRLLIGRLPCSEVVVDAQASEALISMGSHHKSIRIGLKPIAVAKELPVPSWELFIFTCPGLVGSLGWNKSVNTWGAAHWSAGAQARAFLTLLCDVPSALKQTRPASSSPRQDQSKQCIRFLHENECIALIGLDWWAVLVKNPFENCKLRNKPGI